MKTTIRSALAVVAALWLGLAQAADFAEGVEYTRLDNPQPTGNPDRIEVVELFWYACPHCYHFEPQLTEWVDNAPADVEFRRIPAVLSPRWELLAKAWYTADLLGVTDKIHKPLFEAIHEDRQRINTVKALKAFFVDHGVPAEDFDKTFHSFGMAAKLNRARDMTRRYGINGVPSLVINGKYRTSASQAGSHEGMLQVTEYLVEKERQSE